MTMKGPVGPGSANGKGRVSSVEAAGPKIDERTESDVPVLLDPAIWEAMSPGERVALSHALACEARARRHEYVRAVRRLIDAGLTLLEVHEALDPEFVPEIVGDAPQESSRPQPAVVNEIRARPGAQDDRSDLDRVIPGPDDLERFAQSLTSDGSLGRRDALRVAEVLRWMATRRRHPRVAESSMLRSTLPVGAPPPR